MEPVHKYRPRRPHRWAASTTMEIIRLTPGSRSSNRCCQQLRVTIDSQASNWVRSFDPIENPSKSSLNSSARTTLFGNLAHQVDFEVRPPPCREPVLRPSAARTLRPSSRVRQKGIITFTLVRPESPRARVEWPRTRARSRHDTGRHSNAMRPGKPIIGFASLGFEGLTAKKAGVLVRLEVGETNDHRSGMESCRDLCHACDARRSMKNSAGDCVPARPPCESPHARRGSSTRSACTSAMGWIPIQSVIRNSDTQESDTGTRQLGDDETLAPGEATLSIKGTDRFWQRGFGSISSRSNSRAAVVDLAHLVPRRTRL